VHRHSQPSLRGRLAAIALLVCAPVVPTVAAAADRTLLRAAWVATGTGLVLAEPPRQGPGQSMDLELLAAAVERAGLGAVATPMSRAAAEAALAEGRVDLVLPVAAPPAPASVPYRTELDVLLCTADLQDEVRDKGADALAAAFERGWRIVVVQDAPYSPGVAALTTGARADRTLQFADAGTGLAAMAAGEAQCIVASRIAILGALTAAPQLEKLIAWRATDLATVRIGIRYAGTVPAATIAAIDRAILALRADGTAAALEARLARPVLLGFAVSTWWFAWLDVVGTIAFALSGVLIARSEGFSLLGAFVLAALPAVGGGVVRDLLLGRRPIGILADPLPLTLVLGTVIAAYLVMLAARRLAALQSDPFARLRAHALEVTDAAGLAAFTVIGVAVAVRMGAEPLWLWGPVAAGLSGAGGGILRDVLRAGYANPALRTSFYAEVCVIWGFALTMAILFLLRVDQPVLVRVTIGLTVLGAFATRMAVVLLHVRSPAFGPAPNPRSSP
jgi:polar amino acid transport system substrate-binding protein